jgi:hypothetical protein
MFYCKKKMLFHTLRSESAAPYIVLFFYIWNVFLVNFFYGAVLEKGIYRMDFLDSLALHFLAKEE